MINSDNDYTYDAFISYNLENKEFVAKLEKALENFKPPKDLNLPQKHLNVFRFEGDMTGTDYYQSIKDHLRKSAKLIVICSPKARQSKYINDEISRFAEINNPLNIIPILLEGLPNNEASEKQLDQRAFPEKLCEIISMPLAVNYVGINLIEDRVNRGAFEGAWYTLLANIYGISREEIEQRDKKRIQKQRRFRLILTIFIIISLLGLTVIAWIQKGEADNQRKRAEINENKALDSSKVAQEQRRRAEDSSRVAKEQRKLAQQNALEANLQKETAERQKQRALARSLSINSSLIREKEYGSSQLSLLMAIEAAQLFPSWETDKALREAVNFIPRFIKEIPNPMDRQLCQLSKSGRYLILTGRDSIIVLDVFLDKKVFSMKNPGNIDEVKFFANEKYLFLFGSDSRRLIIKFPEGNLINDFYFSNYNKQQLIDLAIPEMDYLDPNGNDYVLIFNDTLSIYDPINKQHKFFFIDSRLEKVIFNKFLFSKDSRFFLNANSEYICVWDLENKNQILFCQSVHELHNLVFNDDWEKTPIITDAAFSYDNKLLALAYGNLVFVYDLEKRELSKILDNPYYSFSIDKISFTPDNKNLIFISDYGSHIRDIHDNNIIKKISTDRNVQSFSANIENGFFTVEGEERTSVFNSGTYQEVSQLTNYEQIKVSSGGQLIATSHSNNTIRIWSISVFTNKESIINISLKDIALSYDNSVAAISDGKIVTVINWYNGETLHKFSHPSEINAMMFYKNDSILLCISNPETSTLYFWDLQTENLITQFGSQERNIINQFGDLIFSEDSKYIFLIRADEVVDVWDINKNKIVSSKFYGVITDHSSDGRFIYVDLYNAIGILKLPELRIQKYFSYSFSDWIKNINTSSGYKYSYFSAGDTLKVFQYPSWNDAYHFEFQTEISKIISCKNQNLIIISLKQPDNSQFSEVHIFDLVKQKSILKIRTYASIKNLFLSEDEKLFAIVFDNGNIKLFDFPNVEFRDEIKTGLQMSNIKRTDFLKISKDDKYLVILGDDNYMRIYDTKTGEILSMILINKDVNVFGFLPESEFIFTRGSDGAMIFLWQMSKLIEKAKEHVLRNFSKEEWNDVMLGEPYRKVRKDLPIYDLNLY